MFSWEEEEIENTDTNKKKEPIEKRITQCFNLEKRQIFDLFRDKKESNDWREATYDMKRIG